MTFSIANRGQGHVVAVDQQTSTQNPADMPEPVHPVDSQADRSSAQLRANAVQGRARFFSVAGMINAATHPLETAGYQARVATKLLDQARLPTILSGLEHASGLPISTVTLAAARAARQPLQLLTRWEPKPGFPSTASFDILTHIADQLDPKTLHNFAQASRQFRQIAGGATQALTLRGPAHLHRLNPAALARLGQRGLDSLTLTQGQFSRHDLESLPASMRNSIRTLHLESALADDAWPVLATFPNLRAVHIAGSDGLDAGDLMRLPAQLQQLDLRMPLTAHGLAALKRFPDLKQITVTVSSGAQLAGVLAELDSDAAVAEEGARHPLAGVGITALRVEHDSGGANLTPGVLPAALKAKLMAHPLVALDMPLRGADLDLLAGLPSLRALRSAGAGMNTADALTIAASEHLEKVELPWNSDIGDRGIQALLDNRRIRALNIGACGGSDALLIRLNKARPAHLDQLTLMA